LGVFYPHVRSQWPVGLVLGTGLLLVVLSVLAFWKARRPWLIVGWLWFLGTLVPVIGLVQVGSQGMADSYSYVPQIGLLIALVWGAAELLEHFGWPVRFRAGLALAALLVLAVCTWKQVETWRDSFTLWQHAAGVSPSWLSYHNLGTVLEQRGKYNAAIPALQ